MNNNAIKFLAFFLLPVILLGVVLAPLFAYVDISFVCLIFPFGILELFLLPLALSTKEHEKNKLSDKVAFLAYMESIGYVEEVPKSQYKVQMGGRYANQPDRLKIGERVLVLAKDGFRVGVSDRYYFYTVDGGEYLLVEDGLEEKSGLYRK